MISYGKEGHLVHEGLAQLSVEEDVVMNLVHLTRQICSSKSDNWCSESFTVTAKLNNNPKRPICHSIQEILTRTFGEAL